MAMIPIPAAVQQILQRYEEHGFCAYVVGGCVRDSLLGNPPSDWDICTSALPHQTKDIFSDHPLLETGIAHGTVTVLFQHQPFEITTFRLESGYSDHRRPDKVVFSTDLVQDLARRDFTMNAMAYHPVTGLVDPFGGQDDLKRHILRCVGQANCRFEEDALRILRAMRFLARLGFSADRDCTDAMLQKSYLLQNISKERIFSELSKILLGDFCSDVLERFSTVISEVIPSLSPTLVQSTANLLSHSPRVLPVRYALLLHSLSAETAFDCLRMLKADNRLCYEVRFLLEQQNLIPVCERIFVKQKLHQFGENHFFTLLQFLKALHCSEPSLIQALNKTELLAHDILSKQPCLNLSQLALSGKDLLALGWTPGKQVGEALTFLLNAVLEEKVENTPNALKEYLTQSANV